MSETLDKIKAVDESVEAALSRVQLDVIALKPRIAALHEIKDAGATPEEMAAIDAVTAKYHALDPSQPQILA